MSETPPHRLNRLILADPNPRLCDAWREQFAELPGVEVVEGRFEAVPEWECMVSAANSFGFMDGGVDLAIIQFFGNNLQKRVYARLADEFLGEQPVGTSLIIETGNARHPYIAHTPTMRVPMSVSRTDYAYVALWAMLIAVRRHNRNANANSLPPIETVVCPGLCTATGRMEANEAARQMALAYRNYVSPPVPMTWAAAMQRQATLARGGDFIRIPSPSQRNPNES